MAKSAKNIETDERQLILIHRNQHHLFWHSTLFNEVYLQNDVSIFHSDVWIEAETEFEIFLNQFRNFVESLDGENPNSWSERTTINRFIKPVLEMLGYTSVSNKSVEPWLEDEPFSFQEPDGLKNYKPDFIIVNDHKELKYIQEKKGQQKLQEARDSVLISIEAKYWDRIEEYRQNKKEDLKRADKKDAIESAKGMDFDEQCLKYMEMLNKQYGILTDGKTWRLYNLSVSTHNYRPYFQFNLGNMVKHVQNSDFLQSKADYELFYEEIKYFYFIFRKAALFSANGEELFVDELLNYSKKYVTRVEDDLRDRFVNAMTIACNGFQRASTSIGSAANLELIRNVAESHIFNILFLKYCEARNILPIKQDPEGYRLISISNTLDRLEGFDPEKEKDNLNYPLLKRRFSDINYNPDSTNLYDRLLKLTKIVQDGTNEFNGFTIRGFKESIFSKEEWKFVQQNKLSNKEMVQILFELGYSKSDIQGRKYQQIPYNSFSPRQLGSIYESFLEFKLEKAETDVAFIKKRWVEANLKSDKISSLDVPKAKKGQLYFSPDNRDRKMTGSYYTPDEIVQRIIAETILPRISKLSSKQILELKICDPAMGSGHFLSGVVTALAKKYLEHLDKETNDDVTLSLTAAKKLILHNCIYGVDINPRAVKLAKMSLWLESADSTEPLEDLEDQMKTGDSILKFNWNKEFKSVFATGGFDFIVGNPPYASAPTMVERDKNYRNLIEASGKYKTLTHKWDLYVSFIELCSQLVKEKGQVGLIIPFAWISQKYAEENRKLLIEKYNLNLLIDLSDEKIFEDATVMTCIIVFAAEEGSDRVRTQKGLLSDPSILNLKEDCKSQYEIRLGGNEITSRISDSVMSMGVPLDSLYFCSVGCVPHSEKENKPKEHYIHPKKGNGHKPYIEAKDFERYLVPKNNRWLAYDYNVVRRPGLPELLESPKILVKLVVGKKGFSAGLDEVGVYTDHSLAGLGRKCDLPKITSRKGIVFDKKEIENSKKVSNKYLALLINSNLIYFIYKILWDASLNLAINDLKKIPVIVPTTAQLKALDQKYDRLIKVIQAEQSTIDLLKEINDEIYALYAISKSDQKYIETQLFGEKEVIKKKAA